MTLPRDCATWRGPRHGRELPDDPLPESSFNELENPLSDMTTPGCHLRICEDPETCALEGRCSASRWHTPTRCRSCGHAYDAAACEDDNCPVCRLPQGIVCDACSDEGCDACTQDEGPTRTSE